MTAGAGPPVPSAWCSAVCPESVRRPAGAASPTGSPDARSSSAPGAAGPPRRCRSPQGMWRGGLGWGGRKSVVKAEFMPWSASIKGSPCLGFFLICEMGRMGKQGDRPSCRDQERRRGSNEVVPGYWEIGVFQHVAPPTRPRLEISHESGFILRCTVNVGNPFKSKHGQDIVRKGNIWHQDFSAGRQKALVS